MDFNIRMFNPQPEPPARIGDLTTGDQTQRPQYYKWKLDRVVVTSYDTHGS